ncbi:hypothetical protein Tco_1557269 [Tanacetum coccineum]
MAGGERRVLTLRGKGLSLSQTFVFEFANASPPLMLKINPSALLSVPDDLTPEEARASILVLLNTLLMLGGSACPSAAS